MTSLSLWVALIGLASSLIFSTLAYALRMMSRVELEERLGRRRSADTLDIILEMRHDLSLTASTFRLISNTLVITATAMYFLERFRDDPHPIKVFGFALLITTPLLLAFSVAIPQAWAKYAGEGLIANLWPMIRTLYWLLKPVVWIMNLIDELIRRLAGVTIQDGPDGEAEQIGQEIMSVIAEGQAEGTVDEEQKKMIEGVISFRDLQVAQIMTPRTDILAVEAGAPIGEVRDKILKDGLSRVPVYDSTLDNVIGILYAKDLLSFLDTRGAEVVSEAPVESRINLRRIMRPPLFVPPTKPLRDLLKEFRLQQIHMAIVLDEYGGTAGLVTTEDIVEQIVGDIADEYERPEPEELNRLDERTIELDARMNIGEVNRSLNLEPPLPEDQDFQTVGGFVINELGVIPTKGQRVEHYGKTITVLESEPRRVKRLRIELPAHTVDLEAIGEHAE